MFEFKAYYYYNCPIKLFVRRGIRRLVPGEVFLTDREQTLPILLHSVGVFK